MDLTYVTSGAVLQCPFGSAPSKLLVIGGEKQVILARGPMANIGDFISTVNIATFGTCSSLANPSTVAATALNLGALTPGICAPVITACWIGGKSDVLIRKKPALLITSKCQCSYGGIISITHDGQIPVPIKNPDPAWRLGTYLLDSVQDVLDIVGLIPGVGDVCDVVNAGIHLVRGNKTMAALSLASAIPGAGVGVGVAKIAAKKVGKQAAKEIGKATSKAIDKVVDTELAFNTDIADFSKKVDQQIGEWLTDEDSPQGLPTPEPGSVKVGIIIDTPIQTNFFKDPDYSASDVFDKIAGALTFGPRRWVMEIAQYNTNQAKSNLLLKESLEIGSLASHDIKTSAEIEKEFKKLID